MAEDQAVTSRRLPPIVAAGDLRVGTANPTASASTSTDPSAPDAIELLTGFHARVGASRIELSFADEHELAELVEALENAAARQ